MTPCRRLKVFPQHWLTRRKLLVFGATLIVTGLLIWVTEYYTGTNYRPVKSVALASTTGHGTNVIQGLAVSLESTALPALVIMAGIIVTYNLAGLFGIAMTLSGDAGRRVLAFFEAVLTLPGIAGIVLVGALPTETFHTLEPWIMAAAGGLLRGRGVPGNSGFRSTL